MNKTIIAVHGRAGEGKLISIKIFKTSIYESLYIKKEKEHRRTSLV